MSWQLSNPERGPPIPSDGVALIPEMKKVCATYAEPFRSIMLALSEDDQTAWAGWTVYWPTEPWPDHPARGRVTLLGDAMHSLLPRELPAISAVGPHSFWQEF
jgi:hypothetical protein